MKYKSEITGWGQEALTLLDPTCNMLVLFNDDAPDALKDISILHSIAELKEDIVTGDTITIGDISFEVTAVGREANATMRDMGHCTISFNGKEVVDRPGVIEVKGKISESDLEKGVQITVE